MRGGFVPGDVVMLTLPDGPEVIGLRTADGGWAHAEQFGGGAAYDDICDTSPRLLVVIDPEDREQTDALAEALVAAVCKQGHEWDKANAYEIRSHMGTALRSLITPPKPPEPQGLGAVVEDADGVRFVRWKARGRAERHWKGEEDGDYRAWSTIAAVKVLSEGVTP